MTGPKKLEPGTEAAPTPVKVQVDKRYEPPMLNFQCPHCTRKLGSFQAGQTACICGNHIDLQLPASA